MSATRSDVLSAAKAACLHMVRARKVPEGGSVEDYEDVLAKIEGLVSSSTIRPAVWAICLGGYSDIIRARYGKKDW